jgi:hypothetical protein
MGQVQRHARLAPSETRLDLLAQAAQAFLLGIETKWEPDHKAARLPWWII